MVFDRADRGFLAHVEMNYHSLCSRFFFNSHVLEIAGTPDRAQVALQSAFVVDIPCTRIDLRHDAFFRDASISVGDYFLNNLPISLLGSRKSNQAQKREKDQGNARRPEDIFRPRFFRKQQYRATLRTSWESFDYTEVIAEAPLIEIGHAFVASQGQNYTLLHNQERRLHGNLQLIFRVFRAQKKFTSGTVAQLHQRS